jgi:hypothetical protein
MNFPSAQLRASSTRARVLPYLIILALTLVQDSSSGPLSVLDVFNQNAGWGLVYLEMRSVATEVRWAFSWEAVAAGVLVFVIWVGLDPYYPSLNSW